MKPHGALTENLDDVLQALQLARKTGSLVLERSRKDEVIERGTLTLLNGQIIDANIGMYRGATALDMLMQWRQCYFVFQPSSSVATPQPFSPKLPQQRPPAEIVTPAPSAPHRIQQIEAVLPRLSSMGLSRTHRQLFLLVDGQRTLMDLARLMGREPNEVEVLLIDLARARLIRF
ncbi:MAG TPA: DUF4388 domain-containing protein [Ktedonobacteraceae bacterium]|nr:DUF4388 domain-containing protein [Ktedonobacteraceae bacterium]